MVLVMLVKLLVVLLTQRQTLWVNEDALVRMLFEV